MPASDLLILLPELFFQIPYGLQVLPPLFSVFFNPGQGSPQISLQNPDFHLLTVRDTVHVQRHAHMFQSLFLLDRLDFFQSAGIAGTDPHRLRPFILQKASFIQLFSDGDGPPLPLVNGEIQLREHMKMV